MAPADDTSERGQILIIVGLLVAVMLVALALVLNSAIFAENLSTRETADSEEPSAYAVDAESTVADVYDRTNANDTRKAVYANTSFNESFETWADSRSDTAAGNGAVFEADWTTYVGWRLEQTENRSFTPADNDSATDWTLATDAENVAAFELEVTKDDLRDSADEDAFNLFVTDGTDNWELFVYRTGGKMVVTNDPATSDECTSGSSRAEINVRAGEFNGSCDELDLPSALDDDLQIKFRNVQATDGTERVNGTYTLVVNGSDAIARDAGGHPERFNASGKMPPTATAVVYAVRYDTRYQRKEVVHDVEGWHSPRAETYQPS